MLNTNHSWKGPPACHVRSMCVDAVKVWDTFNSCTFVFRCSLQFRQDTFNPEGDCEPHGFFVHSVFLNTVCRKKKWVRLLILVGLCLGKGQRDSGGESRCFFKKKDNMNCINLLCLMFPPSIYQIGCEHFSKMPEYFFVNLFIDLLLIPPKPKRK